MNNNIYKTAMKKITASEEFKQQLKHGIPLKSSGIVPKKIIPAGFMLAAAVAVLILSAYLNHSGILNSDEFKITGKAKNEMEACYALLLYYDGYIYRSSEWYSYSRNSQKDYPCEPEEKLGEVTLDLKDILYTGTPPDFSGTSDKGTEIYKIKNVKAERAVLIKTGNDYTTLYRSAKAIAPKEDSFHLKLIEIFHMLSDQPVISALELRSEEDGAWMRTVDTQKLVLLINQELPALNLLTYKEYGPKDSSTRIPVNLMFEDGTALNIQFYPAEKYASIFGGYVTVSEELCNEIIKLNEEGSPYSRITELLPYSENDISSLFIQDYPDGINLQCEDPLWSGRALYNLLKFYRIDEVKESSHGTPVMSFNLGASQNKSSVINFYENENKNLSLEIDGIFYTLVKGTLTYDDLKSYLYNNTELGMAE